MADWNTTLPDTAVVGEETHVEDHNAIVAAIAEARSVVDAAEATIASLQGLLDGKAESEHTHAAADITSGTLAAARIPALDISKVTGLQAALDGKADDGDLTALDTRVAALEAAAGGA